MKLERVKDLANGAESMPGEAQEIAKSCINILKSAPADLGYLWRWKYSVDGEKPAWNYSPAWVNHPDVECRLVFDIPHMTEAVTDILK